MKKIIDSFEIDETLTKPIKKQKHYNKVKNNIPHREDYNFSSDLLMLPTTKKKYRYLLTVVDLWTDECDFQELKTKTPKKGRRIKAQTKDRKTTVSLSGSCAQVKA